MPRTGDERPRAGADAGTVGSRAFLLLPAVLAAAIGASSLSTGASATSARCGSGASGPPGYAYAGHRAKAAGHGVRATITVLRAPTVRNGHVAGWVGVGGPGSGPNGEDQWLQAGIASLPGMSPLLYVEIARAGAEPVFRPLRLDVRPGERHRLAVVEIAARPGWWRVSVDDRPVTRPIRLAGSSEGWQPIATAESWNGDRPVCNGFAFRFEQVGVATSAGGPWQAFVPGYRFQDAGLGLRQLRPAPARARTPAGNSLRPFAFEAVGRA